MPDETDDGSLREPVRHLPAEVVGGGLAELLTHVLGLDWSVSLLAPALTALARTVREADRRQWEQAARAVAIAADELGGPGVVQQQALADASRTELFRRVVQAAGRSTLEEKISALGRVLAAGLRDGDTVDEALLLAMALAAIEAPHVQILATIAEEQAEPDGVGAYAEGWMPWQIANRHPGHRSVMTPILRTLDLHGLLDNRTAGTYDDVEGRQRYVLSDLGRRCLDLLHEA